jgi:ribosomal 50S subunit-recycling heat shock protein
LRVDKYLKVSRIIKRRTIANEACDKERVKVNGKIAKPGTDVKVGDVLEIDFGRGSTKVEILNISEHVYKKDARELYKIL